MRTLLALLLLSTACGTQTREARALAPSPYGADRSREELAASLPLYIYQKDLRVGFDYQLRNSAQFVVVDKDRVRFRVTVVARDESDADTADLKVWLLGDNGARFEPDTRESATMSRIAVGVRPQPYRPSGNQCGTPPCFDLLASSFEVYQGAAEFVFRSPGVATAQQGLTLVVVHQGVELRYVWRFGEGEVVENYGRTRTDVEHGIIELPGPQTKMVATRHEGEKW